jgi:tRNA (Thr-GGU) A37 N-methylase
MQGFADTGAASAGQLPWQQDRMDLNVPLHVIGVAHTRHKDLEATPIQAALSRAERGAIEVDEAYRAGLDGLDGFEYAWLLTWLHQPDQPADAPSLRQNDSRSARPARRSALTMRRTG